MMAAMGTVAYEAFYQSIIQQTGETYYADWSDLPIAVQNAWRNVYRTAVKHFRKEYDDHLCQHNVMCAGTLDVE